MLLISCFYGGCIGHCIYTISLFQDLFYLQLFLHQTIENSFQVLVIAVSLLAQPFDGSLVPVNVEHIVQPKDGLCVATFS